MAEAGVRVAVAVRPLEARGMRWNDPLVQRAMGEQERRRERDARGLSEIRSKR